MPKEILKDPIKVVLVTDLHIDPYYLAGTSNKCDENGSCCQTGEPQSENDTAGKWGDYNCDLPNDTFQSMIKYVKEEIDPDFILWGGDSASHDSKR